MNKRAAGVIFLCIAAFLYAARYVSAAIFGSNYTSWSKEHFDSLLDYVGSGLVIWSIVALAAGIVYLIWAELDNPWRKMKGKINASFIEQIKENWNNAK